jgi:hypothetical protein
MMSRKTGEKKKKGKMMRQSVAQKKEEVLIQDSIPHLSRLVPNIERRRTSVAVVVLLSGLYIDHFVVDPVGLSQYCVH